jgi:hypothetical protein
MGIEGREHDMNGPWVRAWIAAMSDRVILARSVITCLIVGAFLTLINHGDELLAGKFTVTLAWQVGLTFLVPFVVATTSGAAATRPRHDSRSAARPDAASARGVPSESTAEVRGSASEG